MNLVDETTDAPNSSFDFSLSSSEKHRPAVGKTTVDSADMPTPKPVHGFLRLDMDLEESWRFDSSQSALSDLLKDF